MGARAPKYGGFGPAYLCLWVFHRRSVGAQVNACVTNWQPRKPVVVRFAGFDVASAATPSQPSQRVARSADEGQVQVVLMTGASYGMPTGSKKNQTGPAFQPSLMVHSSKLAA
jgi:hypothetical protein